MSAVDSTEAREGLIKIGYPELCRRCDRTVAWARTNAGKRILMDFYACANGRYVIDRQVDGVSVIRRLAHATPNPELIRYTCHFDTCPKRSRSTKRPKGRSAEGHGFGGVNESVI